MGEVWPSEYAKTQPQLNQGNKDFSVWGHIMEKKLGIYRGLAPMLIGAPLQVHLTCADPALFPRMLHYAALPR